MPGCPLAGRVVVLLAASDHWCVRRLADFYCDGAVEPATGLGVGDACCVRYALDGLWYRAQVTHTPH